MIRRCLMLLLFCVCANSGMAQTAAIDDSTPVDTPALHAWLHSGDPRLVAWATVFAQRRHDAATLAEIPSVLKAWPVLEEHWEEPAAAQWRAAVAMSDALIQEKIAMAPAVLRNVATVQPVQALLLSLNMTRDEQMGAWQDWTLDVQGGWGGHMLARVATMLLAQHPKGVTTYRLGWPSSLTAAVLSVSTLELEVTINATGTPRPGFGGGACGDSMGHGIQKGWPRVYVYDVEERPPYTNGITVVDLAGDAIVAGRHAEDQGGGSCFGVDPLNGVTRHRLLAYWLGVSPKEMRWQPHESVAVAWTNHEAYAKWLGATVAIRQQQLRATSAALQQRGFITADATTKLEITVHCDLTPCPLAPADGSH